ncbi:HAD family hydrolase [Streptomyces sp. NPDC090022]|uniref:HAD family hydrolase n=1 Tax=Streptomyces sp. NPDC090022 TaxID=3365920 RepID=UPI003808AEA8
MPDELQAVLFDMDGTLVDTERLWRQAVQEECRELGLVLTDADLPYVLGRAIEDTAAHVASRRPGHADPVRLAAALERRFTRLVRAGAVPLPGAERLLAQLAASGVPTALVSASPRPVVDTVLAVLGRPGFAVTVAARETPRTKPFPDPYQAALTALGTDPAACVAIEDSPAGIASAEAADLTVLAVPSLTPVSAAPGRSVVPSLLDVNPGLLRALAAARAR